MTPIVTRLRAVDLFCGAGGSSAGARSAGFEIAAAVDAWELAAKTHRANFPEAHARSLRLTPSSGYTLLGQLPQIDLILASPECTHHTCARGSKPRDESSKGTARYIETFAQQLRPRWLILENVVHMRSWHGYDALLTRLRQLEYHVSVQALDAADFGVPQNRRRLFILCDRERMPAPVEPTGGRIHTVDKDVVLWSAPYKARPLFRPGRAEDTLARASRAMDAIGRGVPFLIVYYGTDGAGGWQTLDRPLRTITTLDRFGLVTWQGRTPYLRMLQVPELKRAMGFPVSFSLPHGTRRDQIRLLGNAVCPPVMRAVANTLRFGHSAEREDVALSTGTGN